jgi:acetyltransferase-like isoleucine patch superfamily enzyme
MNPIAKYCFFPRRIYRGMLRRILWIYFKLTLGSFGKRNAIQSRVFIECPYNVFMGSDVNINEYVIIQGSPGGCVNIGNRVIISYGVTILTASLVLRNGLYTHDHEYKSVTIEDDVWIAAKAIILPGVKVGHNAVIAAGAVVARDVEPYTVVAGIPAKPVRRLMPVSE